MPLTTSQGERSRVTFRDDVKLSSNQRVGLMTSAVRAWQQQGLCRTKNSQVMTTKAQTTMIHFAIDSLTYI